MPPFKMLWCLAVAFLLGSVAAQTKLRVMPLGDSITEITCWRTTVWDSLMDAHVADDVEFVGSMTNNYQNCVGNGVWDRHHEGHSGALAINIADLYLPDWLAAAKPDIVMFMLGTNDVAQGKSTKAVIAAYTEMVRQMRASNANMKIIVDLVIPLAFGLNAGIVALNNAIPGWVEAQSTAASPIFIADCSTDFPASGLRDGIHPNEVGDAFIASQVFPVLLQTIESALEVHQHQHQQPILWQQAPFF